MFLCLFTATFGALFALFYDRGELLAPKPAPQEPLFDGLMEEFEARVLAEQAAEAAKRAA